MAELKWKDAIIKVLEEEKIAIHYTDIAEKIAEKGYRTSLGATPQDTVSSIITKDINSNKEKSKFKRDGKGYYVLIDYFDVNEQLITTSELKKGALEKLRIVNSFGIYWNRDFVHWTTTPNLHGVQLKGATEVNFKDQIGIYLLYDNREVIYVGQAIGQPLGKRLKDHTTDRLNGRWDRFSWFGFYPVNETGSLNSNVIYNNLSIQDLGDVLESILIESIEPRQNRKQGNLFYGIEYLQQEDPIIKKKIQKELLQKLLDKS